MQLCVTHLTIFFIHLYGYTYFLNKLRNKNSRSFSITDNEKKCIFLSAVTNCLILYLFSLRLDNVCRLGVEYFPNKKLYLLLD